MVPPVKTGEISLLSPNVIDVRLTSTHPTLLDKLNLFFSILVRFDFSYPSRSQTLI